MKKGLAANCARCTVGIKDRICMGPTGKGGKGCPTIRSKALREKARREYGKAGLNEFARQASIQEAECYADRDKRPYVMHPVKPRMLEIVEFARRMNYGRLGLIFCAGLVTEGAIVAQILADQGFEVTSVVCKVGAVPKEEIGLKDEEKIFRGGHESMCNPVMQAMIVNDAETDLNILLGLCVGHDSMFFKYAGSPHNSPGSEGQGVGS